MLLFETNIDTDASFNTRMRAGDGKVFVQAYAANGATADIPVLVQQAGSTYTATAPSACTAELGYAGVPDGNVGIASGCMGWIQVRGKVTDVQGQFSSFYTGSVGHAVIMAATATAGGFYATTGANTGNPVIGEVGVLLEEADASTTTTIYLTGQYATVLDAG